MRQHPLENTSNKSFKIILDVDVFKAMERLHFNALKLYLYTNLMFCFITRTIWNVFHVSLRIYIYLFNI